MSPMHRVARQSTSPWTYLACVALHWFMDVPEVRLWHYHHVPGIRFCEPYHPKNEPLRFNEPDDTGTTVLPHTPHPSRLLHFPATAVVAA
jgi:hypothetical protein